MSTEASMRRAFDQITSWMAAHGASAIARNLAPGASTARLAEVEAELGFTLPPALRALWSVHDGQLEEGNGFMGMFDFLSTSRAVGDLDLINAPLAYLRGAPRAVPESGLTAAELASPAWIPIAGRDSDGYAVCASSGRVVEVLHDDSPPVVVRAASLETWLEEYAGRVVADDYRVERGFGDCYLTIRDREQERRRAEQEARVKAERDRRASTSTTALLDEAIASSNVDLAMAVLTREEASSKEALAAAVAHVFGRGPTPTFAAGALRMFLRRLDLSRDEWTLVAKGGAELANNAIRDVALARAKAATR